MISAGSALAPIIAARGCPDRHRDAVANRLAGLSTMLPASALTEEVDRAIALEIVAELGLLRTDDDRRVIAAAQRWRRARSAALYSPAAGTAEFVDAIVDLDAAVADLGVPRWGRRPRG
jgi:hypothetical protein